MNLTEKWKDGSLETGCYFVKTEFGVEISEFGVWYDRNGCETRKDFDISTVLEVLAPCDYDHFVELTEKVKKQDSELQCLKDEVAKGEKIIGELFYEGSEQFEKNKLLTQLLKECKEHIFFQKEMNAETIALLVRVNAAIEGSQE
ncbi:MAG: hypothetical protein NC124_02420 [Clostridium sp.]|nr:hypothetical protein [Clostridium sp.]